MKKELFWPMFALVLQLCKSGFDKNGEKFGDDEIFGKEFDGNLRYSICGGLLRPSIILEQLEVTPRQFFIPQNVTMSIHFTILEDVQSPIMVKIEILKRLGFLGFIRLPCIANYGSCSFNRICEILDTYPEDSFAFKVSCPKWIRKSGVECKCPIEKGHYGVEKVIVPIENTIVPKWIATGDYKTVLIIEDKEKTVGCFKFQFRLT